MAESFVSGIAENLLGKIASLVREEVSLAWGLETDLKKLQKLLDTVNAVLLDAEEQQAQNRKLRLWLRELKNFCYDAEDVLDELEYEGLRRKVLQEYGNTKIKVRRFFSSSNPFVFRFKMGHKVKELREMLDDIVERKSKFHLAPHVDSRQAGCRSREMTDSLLHMSNVVGRDSDKEKILKFLFQQREGETFSVIPIVGFGGLGKTTLAQMLYNDLKVDEHFDSKMWVCVPEKFEKKQIMESMIKSLTFQNRSDLNPDELQRLIQENLNSKRFLLILDDMWSVDGLKWDEFRMLLEGGAAGSKVIVTTRLISVADAVRTVPSHHLEGLSHEHCSSLFKKFVFREGEEESHPHLVEIVDEIVKKCGGIPLAVKTMGTLLYSKFGESCWKDIRDSEIWKLEQKEGDILSALKLSYDKLPLHLRSCFSICSIYPKGYQFNSFELSQIWMANGLLQSSNEQEMEDIGGQYVKELYWRSFLQDFEEIGDIMSVKMHNMMHDFAVSISQSECSIVNTSIEKKSLKITYMVILKKDLLNQEAPSFLQKENSLRTIIFPMEMRGCLSESFVNTCISASKYLRMLDLARSPMEVLPHSIGGLKHLRSLDLRNNHRIQRLPDSIWRLHNLLFLYLGGCSELEELPGEIRNLIKLRFLQITVKQKRLLDGGIGCLKNLRFLSIKYCPNLEYLFEDINSLTSLRYLNVWGCAKLISLPRTLMYLNTLEYLWIGFCNKFNWTEEDNIQGVKLSLRYLELDELPQVVTLPRWLQKSSKTLQSLEVRFCENLSLFPEWLQEFTSLKTIEIEGCPKLVSLPEWMHRLTSLKELRIIGCLRLVSLPEGMHHLTSLKELRIIGCPDLCKRCKRLEGEDWHKIAHVPNIYIDDSDDFDHRYYWECS